MSVTDIGSQILQPNKCTFFQRFGFKARQEHAATNQQFPTDPWFRSWELMPFTNRWGSLLISYRRKVNGTHVTHFFSILQHSSTWCSKHL